MLTVGAQLEEQAQRSQQQFGGSFSSASVFTVARHDHAAFAELVSTTSKMTATAGARIDGNQQFGSFGTFRLAAQYALFGTTTVRASAGTAFREPSFIENFATGFIDRESGPQARTHDRVGRPGSEPESTTM